MVYEYIEELILKYGPVWTLYHSYIHIGPVPIVTQICIFLDQHYLAYLAPYIIPELLNL